MKHLRGHLPVSRWPGPAACVAGLLAAALALSACAAPDTVASGPAREATVSRGTILAMRPVQTGSAGAGTAVLNGLAQTANAGQDANDTGAVMDFVVQEAGGGTIAVVQRNESHFRVGDPVAIVHGDHTRLGRPGV